MIPGQNFSDRLKSQKEAKLAMLKRAKEKEMDPAEKAKRIHFLFLGPLEHGEFRLFLRLQAVAEILAGDHVKTL